MSILAVRKRRLPPVIVNPRGEPVTALPRPSASSSSSSGTYEGAGSGRRLLSWGLSSAGPNTAISASLSKLRNRSRELVRNNATARGAVESLVSNLVGDGITPRWRLGNADMELKEELQELWSESHPELDKDGVCDFYGLEGLVTRTVIQSGECLVRFVLLPGARGGRRSSRSDEIVPLKLQVIEPDHLDESFSGPLKNGHYVRMGIEFDRLGRRAAYHLFREHPGEAFLSSGADRYKRVRVPASQILHIGKPERPGQIRFVPWLASVILRLHELDQYQDAELVRKKTAAMFGGFIMEPVSPEIEAYKSLGPEDTTAEAQADDAAEKVIALEPGQFPILPPGMDVKFSEPSDVGSNYEKFLVSEFRQVARGLGLTYEQLTGDLTDVNYSSIRAGLIEFRRWCRMTLQQVLVHMFCRPVIRKWLDTAVLSGAIEIPDYMERRRYYQRVSWHHAGFEWVDPVKDITAAKLAVRNGFKTRGQVVAELGGDIEMLDAEQAQDMARARKLGLEYDTDILSGPEG